METTPNFVATVMPWMTLGMLVFGMWQTWLNARVNALKDDLVRIKEEFTAFRVEHQIVKLDRDEKATQLDQCRERTIGLYQRLNGFEKASAALDSHVHALTTPQPSTP